MFKFSNSNKPNLKNNYNKENIYNDLNSYLKIINLYLGNLNTEQKNKLSVTLGYFTNFVNDFTKKIFIIDSTKSEYEFNEKNTDNQYISIRNIEDYIFELCFGEENFFDLIKNNNIEENIINYFKQIFQLSYFEYLKYKRPNVLENIDKLNNTYFDNLYIKPHLYVNTKIDTTNFSVNDIDYIKKSEGDDKGEEVLKKTFNDIIVNGYNDIKDSQDAIINLKYITACTKDYFLNNLNEINQVISKNSQKDLLLNFENLKISRFIPIIKYNNDKVEAIKEKGEKLEILVERSVVFISFYTIISRFRDKDNLFSHFINNYSYGKKKELVYSFKIVTDDDFKKIALNIDNFLKYFNNIEKDVQLESLSSGNFEKGDSQKLYEEILLEGITNNASDIHLVSKNIGDKEFGQVVYRVTGNKLIDGKIIPLNKYNEMINVILEEAKIIKTNDVEKPKSGKKALIVHDTINNFEYIEELRYEYQNEKNSLFIRRLKKNNKNYTVQELGIKKEHVDIIRKIIKYNTNGMFLVCGPTGSGKTTTLNAFLTEFLKKSDDIHLLGVEDPVEIKMNLSNAQQFNVTPNAGFNVMLKSFLRSDPDWILVGEIRDFDVLSTSIEASETGHFTFSTLHTNNTIASLERIAKLYCNKEIKNYEFALDMVMSVLRGILNIKLVPLSCPHCKIETSKDFVLSCLIEKGFTENYIREKFNSKIKDEHKFYKRNVQGCDKCSHTGMQKKKQPLTEIMDLTNQDNYNRVKSKDYSKIVPMVEEGFEYVLDGDLDIEILLKNT